MQGSASVPVCAATQSSRRLIALTSPPATAHMCGQPAWRGVVRETFHGLSLYIWSTQYAGTCGVLGSNGREWGSGVTVPTMMGETALRQSQSQRHLKTLTVQRSAVVTTVSAERASVFAVSAASPHSENSGTCRFTA